MKLSVSKIDGDKSCSLNRVGEPCGQQWPAPADGGGTRVLAFRTVLGTSFTAAALVIGLGTVQAADAATAAPTNTARPGGPMSCTGSNGDFCISIDGNSGGWTFSGANTGSGFYGHLQVKDHARRQGLSINNVQGHGSGWGFAVDTENRR